MDSLESFKYLPLYGARGNELDFLRIVICGNYKSKNFTCDWACKNPGYLYKLHMSEKVHLLVPMYICTYNKQFL